MKLIDNLQNYKGMLAVYESFDCLSEATQKLVVGDCGFGPFIVHMQSFSRQAINRDLIRALLNKYWHTTNTFHFWWGKLAITPYEFGVITGLRMEGEVVYFPEGRP